MPPARYREIRRGVLRAGVVAVVWASVTAAAAQQIVINGGAQVVQIRTAESPANDNPAQNVFVPPERSILTRLSNARRLLEDARYSEAARLLGSILDSPQDYFFQPDRTAPTHRSLKGEAQRLIGQMPPEGRRLYELECGARARQRLGEAISQGDVNGLAEVTRQYFHTQAGYEAALLLGLDYMDRGCPLAGALTLQRLCEATVGTGEFEPVLSLALASCWLQAGMPETAREVLGVLKARQGGNGIETGNGTVAWFADEGAAVEWLVGLVGSGNGGGSAPSDSWEMLGGNASRTASSSGGAPLLNLRWRVPVSDDPLLESSLRRDRGTYLDEATPIVPGMQPLVVGDVVLMRTLRNVLAVDFVTGKRLWEVPVDDPLETLVGGGTVQTVGSNSYHLSTGVGYRVWDDATYGTLSSDGRYVFSIEGLSISTGATLRTQIVGGQDVSDSVQRPFNRLAAHDIRTGKLTWHVGGPAGPSALPLSETFFLGPPLPLMGRLYVLGEAKGEVRLFVLEPDSGELVWSQQLALVERDVLEDPIRRLAGVSPSYADGVLVCPTAAGAIVAIDLASRSLLWGYRYTRHRDLSSGALSSLLRNERHHVGLLKNRWFDVTAMIVDGRVLVAPIESDSLHCLSLVDGERLWSCKRNDDLYVACVHEGNVVLVGRRRVRAVSLGETLERTVSTPQPSGRGMVMSEQTEIGPRPAWGGRTLTLPEESTPSGRGFLSGNEYFLPLSSARVMTIDVSCGKQVGMAESRKGSVPGNLVCYRGSVLSQGVDGLEAFPQLEAVRREADQRLAADPDDPAALFLRGELLLQEGKRSEGLDCVRRSYQSDPGPRTRELLRDTLLDGLRLQFAEYRDCAEEIEALLDASEQRATYLRLMVSGLRDAGEPHAALEHCMELVELDRGQRSLENVAENLSVRRDRWIRGELAAMWSDAGERGEDMEAIDRAIEARLQAAVEADTASLRRFLDYFGDHPAAERARREFLVQLENSGQWLQAELLLASRREASDPSVGGRVTAELAELSRRAGHPNAAAECYRLLGEEYADVICLDGKTGRELFDALPEDGPIRQLVRREDRWPTGKVVKRGSSTSSPSTSVMAVPYRDGLDPFLLETRIEYDQSRRELTCYDALGREQWRFPMSLAGIGSSFSINQNLTHARVCGHLLVVSLGPKIMALDTTDSSVDGQPSLRWIQDTGDPSSGEIVTLAMGGGGMIAVPVGANIQVVGGRIVVSGSSSGNQMSNLGPLSGECVCFQRGRELFGADPLTGEVLWVRDRVPEQSMLFGDDELVFVARDGQTEATVYRMLDGKLLGQREIPRTSLSALSRYPAATLTTLPFRGSGRQCLAVLGRRLLVGCPAGDGPAQGMSQVEMFDPWEQEAVWTSRPFAPNARAETVGREAVGVLEPDGHFTLLGLSDGRAIVDARLDRARNTTHFSVFRSGDRYLLVAAVAQLQSDATRSYSQLFNGSTGIGQAWVYSFDLDGSLSWPEPVEVRNQYLLSDQPGRLPVVTFACRVRETIQNSDGSAARRNLVSALCLDKRTGRVVYDDETDYSTNTVRVSGDPTNQTVALELSRQNITLTFTDEPIPPPSDRSGGLPETISDITRGLFRAAGRAVEDPNQIEVPLVQPRLEPFEVIDGPVLPPGLPRGPRVDPIMPR